MSENFDRYTELFLDEASEQIEELNQNLLTLEREGYDREIINEIFRTAHTLKSSAAFVGLDDLSDLAHHMEDLLQEVKDEKVQVTTELVNLFFQCLDRIKIAVAQVSEGKMPDDTFSDLLEGLRSFFSKSDKKKEAKAAPVSDAQKKAMEKKQAAIAAAASGTQTAPAKAAGGMASPVPAKPEENFGIPLDPPEEKELYSLASGQKVFDGYVMVDPDAPMKNMRFLLLIQNLKRKGTIFRSDPEEDDLEGESTTNIFRFVYFGELDRQELSQTCQQVDMVEEVRIMDRSVGEKKEESRQKLDAGAAVVAEETSVKTRNIKVSSEKIDYLLNSVGELVITNSGLQKIYEDLHAELGEFGTLGELKSKIDQAARIARDLQSGIMKTRMIPVGLVFHRFTRPVRDLALELGKEVDLVFQGEETELDKNIIDALNDPFLHLLRNSLDHGIETVDERKSVGKNPRAKLLLNAYQSGNNIYVEIRDDGRGLNREAIFKKAVERGLVPEDAMISDEEVYNLIFQPGFSTAQRITDVSGRGVGMNVVKKMVHEFKGAIQIQNNPGQGCSFILSFPLTLAIISAILVRVAKEEYAFPLSDVVETIKISRDDITTLQGKEIINLRGDILPVFKLGNLMGLPAESMQVTEEFPVVIANVGNRKLGFIVESMVGKKEIVIKSLEQNFRSVSGLIGACLMGDGSIVMVLDVHGLLEIAQSEEQPFLTYSDTSRVLEDTSKQMPALMGNELAATARYNQQVDALLGAGRRAAQRKGGMKRPIREEVEEREEKISLRAGEREMAHAGTVVEKKRLMEGPASDSGTIASAPAVASGTQVIAKTTETQSVFVPAAEKVPAPEVVQVPVVPAVPIEAVSGNGGASAAKAEAGAEDVRVQNAIHGLESEKKERIQRAQNILAGKKSQEEEKDLTEDEYSRLYAVINTGMINAGFVLSQLLGVTVEVSVPEFKTVEYRDLKSYIPSDKIISVFLDTQGDFKAQILLVFDEANGYHAAADLMGMPADQSDKITKDDVQSVLSELTNIVGASILNALANKTGMSITPSVPAYMHGTPAELTKRLDESEIVKGAMRVIYISADFFREDMELLGRLFLLPSRPTLSQVVRKL